MGRIRTIKPEFPQSEKIGRLSREARLCFVMMWTIADDAGRLRGASRMLASLLYPYDDDAAGLMDAWVDELQDADCIVRYEVNGSQYIQISNWLEHQKIDKPSASKLPEQNGNSATPREHSSNPREASTTDLDLGPGPSIKEEAPQSAAAPKRNDRGVRLALDWKATDEQRQFARDCGLDPDRTETIFRNFWHAKSGKDACKLDWGKTWQNWCLRDAKPQSQPAKKPDPQEAKIARDQRIVWAITNGIVNNLNATDAEVQALVRAGKVTAEQASRMGFKVAA